MQSSPDVVNGPHISLVSNYATRELTQYLSTMEVERKKVEEIYRVQKSTRTGSFGELQGTLFEIHVALVLQTISRIWGTVKPLCIENGRETKNFSFREGVSSDWSIRVMNRNNRKPYTEYDSLVSSNGKLNLPILVEGSSGGPQAVSHSINMNQEKINAKFLPLHELYGTTEFGSIFALLQSSNRKDSPTFEWFKENGGHIATIPIERDEFKAWVQQVNQRVRS